MLMTACATGETIEDRTVTNNWELILHRGEPAPYSGVLVPERSYRYYQTDSALFPACQERLRASARPCPEPEGWLSPRQLSFALLGFVSAVLLVDRNP